MNFSISHPPSVHRSMDWRSRAFVLLVLLPMAHCWSAITTNADAEAATTVTQARHKSDVSPYIDLVVCPLRDEPWSCARQQSARILDLWDVELHSQWQKLKVDADRQLNATIEKRGYSATEVLTKEKPSTILKKLEIGTSFMKEYLAETMDGFLGREYEYLQNTKAEGETEGEDVEDSEDGEDPDSGTNDSEDGDEDDSEKAEVEELHEDEHAHEPSVHIGNVKNKLSLPTGDSSSGDNEFIDIEDSDRNGELKKKGGFNKKKKGKPDAATVLIVKPVEVQHDQHETSSGHGHGHGHGGKPLKQKRKKHKPGGHGDTVVVEHEPSGSLALDLLDELVAADDVLGGGGKKKHPIKYGRSNGVTRGKKKKKKKAIAKLILIGTFLKAKIELLLKILGAHLQIKFFAIALIGLLINIARFWIDVKRGSTPQKVVYVEHAHHQHHYEDHGGDDWGEQGSYWKRSLQTDPTIEEDSYTDSYQPQSQSQLQDAHYLAYRNQWQ